MRYLFFSGLGSHIMYISTYLTVIKMKKIKSLCID
jgi:hypothetical protein